MTKRLRFLPEGIPVTVDRPGLSGTLRTACLIACETWRQYLLGSGQRPEQVVIGMAGKEFFDPLTVIIELLLERAQEFAQAQRQLALGLDDRWRAYNWSARAKISICLLAVSGRQRR
jgi:hypothetical protein